MSTDAEYIANGEKLGFSGGALLKYVEDCRERAERQKEREKKGLNRNVNMKKKGSARTGRARTGTGT